MSGWWVRWRQRQTELADGVDADLVRDNRRRWKMALGLLGGGFVLGLVVLEVRLSTTLRTIVTILAVAAWAVGAVMIN